MASAIENRLLVSQSCDHMVVRLQLAPQMLDSAFAGLLGVDSAGRVAWCNGVAARLLGLSAVHKACDAGTVDSALGVCVAELASLPSHGATRLRLGSGLQVWARAEMQAPDGHRQLVYLGDAVHRGNNGLLDESPLPENEEATVGMSPEHDATPSLHACGRTLVELTVQECGGNISAAARKLRVSRNLIYRRLNQATDPNGRR
jgi:transcriptional regulator of acetoin/glycerol metabolism